MTLWQPTRGILQPNQHWRRPQGSAFDPLTTSPWAFYLPEPAYLFQDAAMTTPVTAANDPVGAMLDLSGNGYHLTQSTAGSRPLYKAAGGSEGAQASAGGEPGAGATAGAGTPGGKDDVIDAEYTDAPKT